MNLFTLVFDNYFECKVFHITNSDILPDSFESVINYGKEFAAYNGKVKVKFDYNIEFAVACIDVYTFREHLSTVKRTLPDFEYYFTVEDDGAFENLKKLNKVTENFELNILLQLNYFISLPY